MGRSPRQLAGLVVLVTAVVALYVAPMSAGHPPAPRSLNQPLKDGCQRSDLGLGFNQSPEWAYVYRSPAIRKAVGVSRVSHPTREDAILQHSWYDWNDNLALKSPFRYLLGGSRARHTGNFSGGPPEKGRLHWEWETHTLPRFAWPTDGDRTTIWGSWIWDCGHWQSSETNEGGRITGERSELHPISAIAVNREAPYLSPRNVSETDVFVSNQGTKAHAVEQCALSHHPESGSSYPRYDSGYTACAMDPGNRIQRLRRHYRFFVPAPPRPPGASQLQYRIASRIPHSSGSQRVRLRPDGISVSVSLKGGKRPVSYGKSFFVSWAGDSSKRPTALEVRLKSLLINQSDPEPIYGAQTSPWNLYLDVNGNWNLLNKWAPGLLNVHDGERLPIHHTLRIHVPHGSGVWLQTTGRECDEPAGTTILGIYANLIHPCPVNKTEQNPDIFKIFLNDDTGTILDTYPSAGAALGRHTSKSAARVNFPGSGRVRFGDVNDAYELTYSIHRAGR